MKGRCALFQRVDMRNRDVLFWGVFLVAGASFAALGLVKDWAIKRVYE